MDLGVSFSEVDWWSGEDQWIRLSGFLYCFMSGYIFSNLFLSDYEQLLESYLFFSDYELLWRPAEGDDCG